MGKATILPSGDLNLERGQYRVRIEKDNTKTEAEFKRIDNEISAADSEIPVAYTEYEDAQKTYYKSIRDLDEIIQQSKESPEEDYTAKLNSASNTVTESQTDLNIKKSRLNNARLKKRSLQGKKLYLQNSIGADDIRIVWCADCQRELEGVVSTVEIPNTDQEILIRPGGSDGSGSEYSASRDGQFRSTASMSPAEAVWNYTLFPAWQRYKPLYRLGKITNRPPNSSKCDVLLDAYSTVQGLATDEERQLYNVEMIYKGRDDGGPYQLGDRVLIRFYNQNREAPQVVGFEQDPCTTTSTSSTMSSTTSTEPPTDFFYIKFTRGDGAEITEDWFTGAASPNSITVQFRDSAMNVIVMERTYNAETGYFRFDFPEDHELDPNGYWIIGNGYQSFMMFFPDTYKRSQWFDENDLLQPGTYSFELPYFLTDYTFEGGYNSTYTVTLIVYSSAPWQVQYVIQGQAGRDCFARRKRNYGIAPFTGCCYPLGYWDTFQEAEPFTASIYVSGGGIAHVEGGKDQAAVDLSTTPANGALAPIAGAAYVMTAVNNTPDQRPGHVCTCGSVIGQQFHYFVSNDVSLFHFSAGVYKFPWEDF